ncbi:hypothetical protein PENTCL1PPCAC_30407, partial [Pristionchus entomophagus]
FLPHSHLRFSFLTSLHFSSFPNMLGMMNSPSNGVDFYASNPGKISQQLSVEDTKALTEPKEKPQTTYTQDGRMMVGGKVVERKQPAALWTGLLLKSAIQQIPLSNENKEKKMSVDELNEESKEEMKEEITPSDEPIISAAPPRGEETQ